MPTYTVTTANVALSPDQKARIAAAITQAHHAITGAPGYFAQVIFTEIDTGSHFLGGKPNTTPHIYVLGLIRGGRTEDMKQRLMLEILEQASAIAGVGAEDVWVYVQDVPAGQMAEFGRILPPPGAEPEWRRGMSRQKIAALTRAGVAF